MGDMRASRAPACTLHKPHTLLYYCVRSLMMPVGLIFAIISPLQELCTATAVHHRLSQGWANAYNTKVGRLLRFLSDGSHRPIIDDFQTRV